MEGKIIETWNEERALENTVKEMRPGEAKKEIRFESPEEIEAKNQELLANLAELEKQMESAKDPKERNFISGRILHLIADSAGGNFLELKRQANT